MATDTLFILERSYFDEEGTAFYCRDCIEVDGLLGLFPELAAKIDVVRVAWAKPRTQVVDALGEANQNCPALAFAEGGFVNTQDALLAALHERHGFPIRSS
ncbi:DUF3088 family protein [Aurantiacibacter aquimixticola]|uniref:DUF3088 family protein n=1 Tax=Aurantiacibacter aquimixticola TaxID=1958945 RepID=A0A419RUB1_9SPHN|nr:DUF3088 family protein [Aurantiacibacter aquimixticola]RJY09381.1 DUF3088 family protein [Aurantiacibacter aquimixticola]